MSDIFNKIVNYLEENETGILATIIWTSGSTPAPPQAKMLLSVNGKRIAGTIGGGCIEDTIIRRVVATEANYLANIIQFELNNEETESGLICGGSLKVLIERIDKSHIELFRILNERIKTGKNSILVTKFRHADKTIKSVLSENSCRIAGEEFEKEFQLSSIWEKSSPVILEEKDVVYIAEPIEGKIPLFIFGGGHVGAAISKLASNCGFSVRVVDDRIEYSDKARFPEADETICIPFRLINSDIGLNENSYVVIVTRGHTFDELVLEKVINLNPEYIGMIGSKRKVLITFKNLIKKGIAKEKLEHVYAPVGLDIGAVSVEEIAISVVAEMIKIRRKKKKDSVNHKKIEGFLNNLTEE